MAATATPALSLVSTKKQTIRFGTGSAVIGAHEAQWAEAYPFWQGVPDRLGGPSQLRPSLLRYDSDDFMKRLASDLGEAAALAAVRATGSAAKPVKFFLPFHGQFALCAASFVCNVPGHPDRSVKAAEKQSVWFVIRRVRTVKGVEIEEGWVQGKKGGWVEAGTPNAPKPIDDEQKLPLVKLQALGGRTVWVGYIPLASMETYTTLKDDSTSGLADFNAKWSPIEKALKDIQEVEGRAKGKQLLKDLAGMINSQIHNTRLLIEGQQAPSASAAERTLATWLLDASHFQPLSGTWAQALLAADPNYDLTRLAESTINTLEEKLCAVDPKGEIPSPRSEVIFNAAEAFKKGVNELRTDRYASSVKWLRMLIGTADGSDSGFLGSNLPDVAMAIRSRDKTGKFKTDVAPDAPGYEFWTASKGTKLTSGQALNEALMDMAEDPSPTASKYDVTPVDRTALSAAITAIGTKLSDVVLPKYPVSAPDVGIHFVVRCAFACDCCPRERLLFSNASDPWYPAQVFDPEAPARKMLVPMPVDLDPKKLGAQKGLGFMLGSALRKQMARVNKDMLKDPANAGKEPSLDMGAICSFSIPIVTICALLLLMIVVNILNFIFHWLPYFVVCYPAKLPSKPAPPGS